MLKEAIRRIMESGAADMLRSSSYFYGADFGNPYTHGYGYTPRTPPQPTTPPEPHKAQAIDKCRKLSRLAASSTFEGERDNANRQRAKIMERHGITEREL